MVIRVLPVDRWHAEPVRPDTRDAVGGLNPAAQLANIDECDLVLRPAGKADHLNLNGGEPIGLRIAGMLEGRRRNSGIEKLVDRVRIDEEMRSPMAVELAQVRRGVAILGRVQDDAEWASGIGTRITVPAVWVACCKRANG